VDLFQEAEMLRKVPMFGGLNPAELKLLAFTSRVVRFAPGESLMRKGDPADCAYVILEGEVEILGETSAGEFVIAVQGRNAVIGEMGVLSDAPRSATVRATEARRALRNSGENFLRLACENPDRALHVMRQLSARLAAGLRAQELLKQQLQEAQDASGRGAAT
jgi:CRP-like cAMP-binding protein